MKKSTLDKYVYFPHTCFHLYNLNNSALKVGVIFKENIYPCVEVNLWRKKMCSPVKI